VGLCKNECAECTACAGQKKNRQIINPAGLKEPPDG
jgi:hypothetical protein